MLSLFLSNKGRIGRKTFIFAFLAMSAFIALGNMGLAWLGETTNYSVSAFFVSLFAWSLFLYVPFCVYGKRLHDIGRSSGLTIVMYTLIILTAMIVMLVFGGADYFSEFSQYSRKQEIDPAIAERIQADYIAKQSANMNIIKPIMLAIPVAYTLWLCMAQSDPNSNKYGDPATL